RTHKAGKINVCLWPCLWLCHTRPVCGCSTPTHPGRFPLAHLRRPILPELQGDLVGLRRAGRPLRILPPPPRAVTPGSTCSDTVAPKEKDRKRERSKEKSAVLSAIDPLSLYLSLSPSRFSLAPNDHSRDRA